MDTSLNDINDGAFSTTEMRRRYPKDNEGIKDEWRALVKHHADINEMIIKHERELKQLKQQELGQAYNHRLQELIRLKEQELRQKQDEAQMVAMKAEQYRQDMMRQQEDKAMLQQYLGGEYNSHIANRHQNEQMNKERQLEQEKRMIEETKRRMEEARQRELMKQEEYYQVFNDEIKRAEEKNQKLVEDKIKEKLDYRDNIRENERKQILKEENYRNFFKLSNENQKKLIDLHAQNVLSPQIQKDQQFTEIVDKRINEERERQMQDEFHRRKVREDKNFDVSYANKDKMGQNEYYKNLEKMDKQMQVQESLRQSLEYQGFLKTQKDQKAEQQRVYKEFLDRQQQEHNERERLNKMTKHEKKINFGDLQAYKGYDPKLYGLIPGWINTKYAHPIGGTENRRSPKGNTNIYADTLARLQEQQEQETNLNGSKSNFEYNSQGSSPNSPYKGVQNQNQPGQSQYDEVATMSPQYSQPKFAGLSQTYSSPHQDSYKVMPQSVKGSHNPITNPLPVNVQNPYIAREINKISQRRPYFANMASTNLVG